MSFSLFLCFKLSATPIAAVFADHMPVYVLTDLTADSRSCEEACQSASQATCDHTNACSNDWNHRAHGCTCCCAGRSSGIASDTAGYPTDCGSYFLNPVDQYDMFRTVTVRALGSLFTHDFLS
jgi:hypothetical protein